MNTFSMDTVSTSVTPVRSTDALQRAISQTNAIILGKDQQIRLCLACLLAKGHLLIEDIPCGPFHSAPRWSMIVV